MSVTLNENALKDFVIYTESFIFCGEIMNDILYDIACMYSALKNVTYKVVLGRKGQSYELMLHFPADSFFHLAGLHYLTDLNFKTTNKTLIFRKILNHELTIEDIQKSVFYVKYDIEDRLSSLHLLCEIIESADAKYLINQNLYRTYTTIIADYLMEYQKESEVFYLFCFAVRQNPIFVNECICRSFFRKNKTDFCRGTMVAKVLLIQRIMNMGTEVEKQEIIYKNPVYHE